MSEIKHRDGSCSICNRIAHKELNEATLYLQLGKDYLLTTRPEDLTIEDALEAFGLESDGDVSNG